MISRVPRIRESVFSLLGVVVGLLTLNRPRFWWQELFHNSAFYWVVPVCGLMLWLLVCVFRRGFSWQIACGILGCLYGVSATFASVATAVMPRHITIPVDESIRVDGAWIDSWSVNDDVRELTQLIVTRKPLLVAMQGRDLEPLDALPALAGYVHRIAASGTGEAGSLRLYSRVPLRGAARGDLGLRAFPGGWGALALSETQVLEVGFISLMPSYNQELFERNRVSARRLSSLMRNSESPRIVLANFNATPTSQLVAVYSNQTRMYSLRFGTTLSNIRSVFDFFAPERGLQAFVSKQVAPESFELLSWPKRARPLFYFSVQVPRDVPEGERTDDSGALKRE